MKTLALLSLTLALTACQAVSLERESTQTSNTTTETHEATDQPYYVIVRPDSTKLVAVADDGKAMYFEFDLVIPLAMEAFDLNGKKLVFVRNQNLGAVAGLHKGVLLRLANAGTFVGVRPDTPRPPLMDFVPSAQLSGVRAQLERNTPWHKEMERVIAKVSKRRSDQVAVAGTSIADTRSSTASVARVRQPQLLRRALRASKKQ